MLTAFTLENYRSFADPTTIELRPLTLLFGYNNSGKSALLRALALIAASARPSARMPLDLKDEAARDGNFDDVRSKLGSDTITLGLTFEDGALTAEYAIAQEPGGLRQIITEVRVTEGETKIALEWLPPDQAGPSRYSLRLNGQATAISVEREFVGLVPDGFSNVSGGLAPEAKEALDSLLSMLGGDLLELGRDTQWIGSMRSYPERSFRYRGEGLDPVGFDGSNVGVRLADDKLMAGPLLPEISAWYERAFARRLDAAQAPDGSFSITLEPLTPGAGRQINLADTGEGMAQVLPVLVVAAMARRGQRDDPTILAIEQPELHLHPKVHALLAEHLCDLAAKEHPPRLLIETHSENFLLGVQIQIVKGELPPDRVLVYWVRQLGDGRSFVTPITFDEEGRPHGVGPPDVFSEDIELMRQLIQKRKARKAQTP